MPKVGGNMSRKRIFHVQNRIISIDANFQTGNTISITKLDPKPIDIFSKA